MPRLVRGSISCPEAACLEPTATHTARGGRSGADGRARPLATGKACCWREQTTTAVDEAGARRRRRVPSSETPVCGIGRSAERDERTRGTHSAHGVGRRRSASIERRRGLDGKARLWNADLGIAMRASMSCSCVSKGSVTGNREGQRDPPYRGAGPPREGRTSGDGAALDDGGSGAPKGRTRGRRVWSPPTATCAIEGAGDGPRGSGGREAVRRLWIEQARCQYGVEEDRWHVGRKCTARRNISAPAVGIRI
ncbi:hypothetical protein C8J57DRAFT_1228140 [Mycena rebaudengoi]|nr:hypothetical protein C8J57DRAFT_1228140 [Mycena rebaudengoi]